MKATLAKRKIDKGIEDQQLELIYREDRVNEYWDSRLFNRVYLTHDIKDKVAAWNDDQYFPVFQDKIKNILNAYKGKERALETMSERNLQNSIVKDILVALNWANDEDGPIKPFIDDVSFTFNDKTYKPDIIVLEHSDDNQKVEGAKAQDRLDYARRCSQMVVEVKYWNRIEKQFQREKEDKSLVNKDRQDDLSGIVSPNDQTIRYMDLLKLNWGILTDGTKWRLFNKDLSVEGSDRYYEFNFYKLFKAFNTAETKADHDAVDEGLKYFFHFFAKQSFFPEDGSEPLVDHVLKDSKKYADKIEEDLKSRFLEAMNLTCNAIHDSSEFRKIAKAENLNQEQANSLIVNTAESILFNIMFIKSLETRRVLPMASTDYKKLSLTSTLWKIEKYNPENSEARNAKELERMFSKGNGNSFAYTSDGFAIHDRISRLINAIHKGSKKDDFGFEISGFKETIFSDQEWKVFNNCTIPNKDWVAMLFMLGYTQSETLGFRKYQQIPYEFFTPRQLGSIYESFLEFKLEKADMDMIFAKGSWQAANLESDKVRKMDVPKVWKGKLYFTPNNAERKATGSYYTPDEVVQLIVNETLSPLVKKKTSTEILKLRLADAAMGSGHFLSGALTYLAQRYLEALKKEIYDDLKISLQEAKQEVLHNSLFGVDINPRAVKLAKMSLWLDTACAGKCLENLDDQIKTGDSLVELDWKKEFSNVIISGGFDAIIGNPPYLKIQKLGETQRNDYSKLFKTFSGASDIYVLFIEKSLQLLKSNGNLGIICPNSLKDAEFAKLIRREICTYNPYLIYDFGLNQLFEGATTYTMLLFVSKKEYAGESTMRLYKTKVDFQEGLSNFSQFKSELTEEKWVTVDIKTPCLEIKSGEVLKDYCETIFVGLQITPSELFGLKLVGEEKEYFLVESKIEPEPFRVEKGVCRRLLKSSDIKKFKYQFSNNLVIFPYLRDAETGKYRLMTAKEIQNYPAASAYIKRHKELLENRDKGKWHGRKDYYAYSRVQNLELHERDKIIICGTSSESRFAFCKDDFFLDRGSFGIILNSKGSALKEKLLTILNSESLDKFIKAQNKPISGGYYPYQTKTIENFPVPAAVIDAVNSKMGSAEIEKLYFDFHNKTKKRKAA